MQFDPKYKYHMTDSLLYKTCFFCDAKLKMSDTPTCEECLAALKEVVQKQRNKKYSFLKRFWYFLAGKLKH